MNDTEKWIQRLDLKPHPEGGFFREIYRSEEIIFSLGLPKRFKQPRCFSTSIYYLLEGEQISHFHRLKSDEIWHFYSGSSLTIHIINCKGKLLSQNLGNNPELNQSPQVIIPHQNWFAAEVDDKKSYTLVGCTVAPGFDFNDFELGKKSKLIQLFPDYRDVIERFSKE